MKLYSLIFSIAISLALSSTVASAEDLPLRMKLYFVEFNVADYGPTTEEVIEKFPSIELWFYGKNQFVNNLKNKLESHPITAKLDTDTIRLKLVIIDGSNTVTFLVDREGTVLRSINKKTFKISKQEKAEIEAQVINFKGVVDKRPTLDPWGTY